MPLLENVVFAVVIIIMCWDTVLNVELTVTVEPGKEDCFYENFSKDQLIAVDYQVLSGGQGKFDITFQLYSPSGDKLAEDVKEPDHTRSITAPESGVYAFCWDNSFSHFNSKTVYFEIYVADELKDYDDWKKNSNILYYDDALPSEIQESMERILDKLHENLNQVRSFQTTYLHVEARDRILAEKNFEYVNWWAMMQLSVMVVVGIIQVISIRSLFQLDPRANNWWPWGPRR